MSANSSTSLTHPLTQIYRGGTASARPDDELLARWADGCGPEPIAALIGRHGPLVLGVCRRILGDGPDADDAFQATFLVLVRRARTLRDPERLAPWLHAVATRIALRARRRWRTGSATLASSDPRLRLVAHSEEPSEAETPSNLELSELRRVLDEEVARLPKRYREPFVLCVIQGLSRAEGSSRLGCPAGTLDSRIARARGRLRDRLSRRGFSPGVLVGSLGAPESGFVANQLLFRSVPETLLGSTVTVVQALSIHSGVPLTLWVMGRDVLPATLYKWVAASSVGLAVVTGTTFGVVAMKSGDDGSPGTRPPQGQGPLAVASAPLSDEPTSARPADSSKGDPKQSSVPPNQDEQEPGLTQEMTALLQIEAMMEQKALVQQLQTKQKSDGGLVGGEGDQKPDLEPEVDPSALGGLLQDLGLTTEKLDFTSVRDDDRETVLREILRLWVETNRKRLESSIEQYRVGVISVDRLIEASRDYRDALYYTARADHKPEDDPVILRAFEHHLGRMIDLARRAQIGFNAGLISSSDINEIKNEIFASTINYCLFVRDSLNATLKSDDPQQL